jgi:nucleoside-diphosphate-sugar epimerase
MDPISLRGAKVLVIGANSFIGAHLVPEIVMEGGIVYSTDRKTLSTNSAGKHYQLDITDLEAVKDLIKDIQPDYIFNFSGFVQGGRTLENLWPTFKVNLEGTINLLTALQQYPCKRLILLGSMEELQEEHPVSPYAASKIAASSYARMFYTLFSTPVVIAQLFMVYGPNQKDERKLVPYTIQSILNKEIPHFSSGVRQTDWVYVGDIVSGLIQIATYPGIEGASIQFGTGRLSSVKEVITNIFELMKVEASPVFGNIEDRKHETTLVADVAATKTLIGWEANTSLKEGLKKTVAWYQEYF